MRLANGGVAETPTMKGIRNGKCVEQLGAKETTAIEKPAIFGLYRNRSSNLCMELTLSCDLLESRAQNSKNWFDARLPLTEMAISLKQVFQQAFGDVEAELGGVDNRKKNSQENESFTQISEDRSFLFNSLVQIPHGRETSTPSFLFPASSNCEY
ncbi:hypothetical protein VNO77_37933 [Canavalia gladiata]|uniref:Uncharacterized protein n=1 Tax=Canavalia gladiata TaxID=3824 RepID=A0AAN9KBA3_CANGL